MALVAFANKDDSNSRVNDFLRYKTFYGKSIAGGGVCTGGKKISLRSARRQRAPQGSSRAAAGLSSSERHVHTALCARNNKFIEIS